MNTTPEKFLIFDTETGGFPSNKYPKDHDRQPPVCQIGAILCTKDEILVEFDELLKVGTRYIHPKAEEVHGFSQDLCNEFGKIPYEVIADFNKLVKEADVLVCHNFAYDSAMMEMQYMRELPEKELLGFQNMPHICTMLKTEVFCNLKGRYSKLDPKTGKWSKPKWPKLEELYKILFDEEFENAHNAMADVRATHRCFFDARVFPFPTTKNSMQEEE